MEEPRDEKLWIIARKRAHFRRSVYTYLIINGFLWAIWWFTMGKNGYTGFPWPLWVMLGWGVGLAIQYFDAYRGNDEYRAEREYEKLKKRQP